MLRILKVLIYKNLLVARRKWKSSLFLEILLPLLFIFVLWVLSRVPAELVGGSGDTRDKYYTKYPINYRNMPPNIYYAPNNSFTNELMNNFNKIAKLYDEPVGFQSEEDLIRNVKSPTDTAALIFDEKLISSSKILTYKIMKERLTSAVSYYKGEHYYLYERMKIPEFQTGVLKSFIKTKNGSNDFDHTIFLQQVPDPAHSQTNDVIYNIKVIVPSVIFIVIFSILLLAETSKASQEKFLGVHVLMTMNGVTNFVSILSSVLSGFIFIFVFIVLPAIVWLSVQIKDEVPVFNYGNKLIIVLVFTAYIFHLLTCGIHIAAYFSKAIFVTFALVVFNYGYLIFTYYIVINKDILPYLGILFPTQLFSRAMEEILSYEISKTGIGFGDLFKVGDSHHQFVDSVGMVLIFSIIGIIFHFTMALYIYAIKPGQYGTPKHPLFFLEALFSKSNKGFVTMHSRGTENMDQRLFETVNEQVYKPGIKIRNLKKIYQVGFINKSEVHALKGVSIDFYKGQITSLLGHNGAGKTTMMSVLTGMTDSSDGSIQVNSKDLKQHANEIRNDMGLCTQQNMVFPTLSVYEQLLIFAMLKGKQKTRALIEQNIRSLLEKLKISDKSNALPDQLSGGQKRRLCLAMAIISDPSILILDEPTSGLDPENRRVIWDILLKMKGQKTILISTHDMEEADILGDRIAILHGGQFRSYGTTFFLKKILGEGNVEINLSTQPWCDIEQVLNEFEFHTRIVNQDGGKIVLSTKNTLQLPDSLDRIESKKKTLGVTGLSVSLLTLEQVFLKVTQDKDDPSRSLNSFDGSNRVSTEPNCWRIIKGLFYKKMTYTIKNLSTLLAMLAFVIVATFFMVNNMNQSWIVKPIEVKPIPVKLDMYNQPQTFYKSDNSVYGTKYKQVTENSRGKATEVKSEDINEALLEYGRNNLVNYNDRVVAAMESRATNFTLLHNENLGYSIPITLNLFSNTVLKSLFGDEYSVSLSLQDMNIQRNPEKYVPYQNMSPAVILDWLTAATFIFTLFPALSLFVSHPLQETTSKVKHLQKMTGASYFTYWTTMFIFDFLTFFLATLIMMISLVVFDNIFDVHMYYVNEVLVSLLLFGLFAISSLPFIYIFSFIIKQTSTAMRVLIYLSMFLIVTDYIAFLFKEVATEPYKTILKVQRPLYYLFPQTSYLRGQISLLLTLKLNARCRSLPNEFYAEECLKNKEDLCCTFECWNGECKNYKPFFQVTKDPRWSEDTFKNIFEMYYDLGESLVCLAATSILYFVILAVLEFKLIPKLFGSKTAYLLDNSSEERVRLEKSAVSEKISELEGNTLQSVNTSRMSSGITRNNVNSTEELLTFGSNNSNLKFLVYELQKRYGNLQAVKDVSFRVFQQECFGLLGVNGAGKSTTFKMMTGEELLDHGVMYVGDKDYASNKNLFLSKIGYCPQNDALIMSLNSFEHLRLFGRLRGIPENQLDNEVQLWIQRLNLKACAARPSGTYSGGNKRRLNIAIALIGLPDIVLMDEPTTGVDPGARRSLWTVIQACQATGQAVILTSHSMEECEALCNRLAIMVDGRFVCIGASQELKQRFGTNYNVQIKMDAVKSKDQVDQIKQDMRASLDCEVADENMGYIMYHVKPDKTTWRKMYDVMNGMKSKYDCIDDFSVSSSTLEQLFLYFAKSAQNRTS